MTSLSPATLLAPRWHRLLLALILCCTAPALLHAAQRSVSWNAATYSVDENAGGITVRLIVDRSGGAVDVHWQTVNESATAGTDFVAGSGIATVSGGSASNFAEVTVIISDNALNDGDRTFGLQITQIVNGNWGTPNYARVTIVDDDTGAAPPPTDVNNGLGAYWSFENVDKKNVTDDSGNGNTGKLNQDSLVVPDAIKGDSALSLSGDRTSMEVNASSSLQLQTYTIAGWVRTDFDAAATESKVLIARYGNTNTWDYVGGFNYGGTGTFVDGEFVFLTRNLFSSLPGGVSTALNSGVSLADGQWHHIAVTVQQFGPGRLYVDGTLVDSVPFLFLLQPSNVDTIIGNLQKNDRNYALDGSVDDLRIYNRAISEDEVLDLSMPDPAIHLTLDQVLTDSSGQQYVEDQMGNAIGLVEGAQHVPAQDNGGALYFNGAGARVELTDSPKLHLQGDITMAAWVIPSSAPGSVYDIRNVLGAGYVKQASSADSGETFLRMTPSGIEGGAWMPGNTDKSSAPVPYRQLSFVVSTYSSIDQMWRLYVDGALIASTQGTQGAVWVNGMRWGVGGRALSNPGDPIGPSAQDIYRSYTGIIDDVRLFSSTLRAPQIGKLFRDGIAPLSPVVEKVTAPSVVYWNADYSLGEYEIADLDALVLDDGKQPWSVSLAATGPGAATFTPPGSVPTKVTFSLPGSYDVAVSASNTAGSTSLTTGITAKEVPVVDANGGTHSWEAENFADNLPGANPAWTGWQASTDIPGTNGDAMVVPAQGLNRYDTLSGPALLYFLHVSTPGRYRVDARMFGVDHYSDSIHLALDGQALTFGRYGLELDVFDEWHQQALFERNYVEIDLPTIGAIVPLQAYMREDETYLDSLRIVHESNWDSVYGVYVETGGQLVFEAEGYHREKVPHTHNRWVPVNDGSASSRQYMTVPTQSVLNLSGSLGGPYLGYNVRVTTPGRYQVSVRLRSTSYLDDSIQLGVDGVCATNGPEYFGLSPVTRIDDWDWSASLRGEDVYLDLTAGNHVIDVWMRESNTDLDQIELIITPVAPN
ncbi:MAG: hypothetical protein PF961_01890 [Planctomycetota bacterium]|jgi:hypothetical protein|nr:hypothetical protein [Planctomycetota bacterium]